MISDKVLGFIIALILVIHAYAQEAVVTPIQPSMMEETTFIVPTLPAPPAPIEPIIIEEPVKTEVTVTPVSKEESITNPNNELNIGLSADVRQKIASILNKLLADEFVLYTKTLKFHWNVQGIVFHDFHAAFKEQYEKLFDFVDSIAERARALGAPALGSLQDFSTYKRLKETNSKNLSAIAMVKELLADHEAIIRTIRQDVDETARLGDQGTSNFLQDILVKHEKIACMLRATAQ